MKSNSDRIMIATLSRHANYNEKQLLKSGEIAKCLQSVLRRRRKIVNWVRVGFIAFCVLPILIQTAEALFSSQTPSRNSFGVIALFAIMQLPTLLDQRLVLSRLETIASIWLLDNSEDDEDRSEGEAAALEQLVLSIY